MRVRLPLSVQQSSVIVAQGAHNPLVKVQFFSLLQMFRESDGHDNSLSRSRNEFNSRTKRKWAASLVVEHRFCKAKAGVRFSTCPPRVWSYLAEKRSSTLLVQR